MKLDPVVAAGYPSILWPGRLRELALLWRHPVDARARDAALTELWNLLNVALHRYVRAQSRRFRGLDDTIMVDVAADKTQELLGRLDRRQWDPGASSDARICAFLASVARNGVVDVVRRRSRELSAAISSIPSPASVVPSEMELSVDGMKYATTLVACARRLTARARLAWFLRVFNGLSPGEIARHSEIRTTTAGVHLILNRSRRQIRQCVMSQGFDPGSMPPGTFTALWELIDADRRARAGCAMVEAKP